MNYIVLDLEWNQASRQEDSDPELPFEIVEIGAVKLNEDRKMVSEFSKLVKPQVYTTMHQITGKLIHLQMQQLMSGEPFEEAYEAFKNWCGDDPFFCTWGPADLPELQRNMRYFGLPALSSGPKAYLDVQKLFNIAFDTEKTRRSLEYAVDKLGIERDIPFHRAFSDAYYAAAILARIPDDILGYCSYDVFHLPKDKEHEIHTVFRDYCKYISRAFPDRERLLTDRGVMSCRCYLCGRSTKPRVRWFTTNNRHFIAVSLCETHGLMKTKVRIRHNENDEIYADKTQKFIDKKQTEALRRKREIALRSKK